MDLIIDIDLRLIDTLHVELSLIYMCALYKTCKKCSNVWNEIIIEDKPLVMEQQIFTK